MNTLIPIIGIFGCLVLVLVPSAGATGGSEGWIRIDCNVDGASVSFDGIYQGSISGGSLTVPVDAGFPFHSFSVEKSGYSTASGPVTMPPAGETTRVSAILTPVPAGHGGSDGHGVCRCRLLPRRSADLHRWQVPRPVSPDDQQYLPGKLPDKRAGSAVIAPIPRQ